jgi:hypothetical protein
LGSHTKRKVPARHASALSLLARLHLVAKSGQRAVYVSVKTIHLPYHNKKALHLRWRAADLKEIKP